MNDNEPKLDKHENKSRDDVKSLEDIEQTPNKPLPNSESDSDLNSSTKDSKPRSSIWGGFFIGIAATLLIGGGTCAVMLSNIGGGNGYDSKAVEQQNLLLLQQTEKEALQSNGSIKAKWLYAHILENDELRHQLQPTLTEEQAKSKAEELINMSIQSGYPNALYEQGYTLIKESLKTENTDIDDDYMDYRQVLIQDNDTLNEGILLLAKALSKQCEFSDLKFADEDEIINALEYDSLSIDTSTLLDLLSNPALQNYKTSLYNLMAILIHESATCSSNYIAKELLYRQSLSFEEGYHIQHRAYDYVLAQALGLNNAQKFIQTNIPEDKSDQFEQEVQNIETQYEVLFNQKPENLINQNAVEGDYESSVELLF